MLSEQSLVNLGLFGLFSSGLACEGTLIDGVSVLDFRVLRVLFLDDHILQVFRELAICRHACFKFIGVVDSNLLVRSQATRVRLEQGCFLLVFLC